MSDIDLEKSVLEKYPQYADLAAEDEPVVAAPVVDTPPIVTPPVKPESEFSPLERTVAGLPQLEEEQPWYKKAWNAVSEPLTDAPSRFAKSISPYIDDPSSDYPM